MYSKPPQCFQVVLLLAPLSQRQQDCFLFPSEPSSYKQKRILICFTSFFITLPLCLHCLLGHQCSFSLAVLSFHSYSAVCHLPFTLGIASNSYQENKGTFPFLFWLGNALSCKSSIDLTGRSYLVADRIE